MNWVSFDFSFFTLPLSLELLLKLWEPMISSSITYFLFPFSLSFLTCSLILISLSESNCSSSLDDEGSGIFLWISLTFYFIFLLCFVCFLISVNVSEMGSSSLFFRAEVSGVF